MEDPQVTALREMMGAVNAGDAKRYAMLYAQDAAITIYGSGELKGRGAIEQHEINLLREFPGTRLAFYSMWQKGALAVVHYAVNGPTPGGQPMGHEGLLFYRFHPSGLIEQEHRYLDSLTPMAQMGMFGAIPTRALPALPSEMKVYVANNSPEEKANIAIVAGSLTALDSQNEPAFLATIAVDAVFDELIQPRSFIGKREVKVWLKTWNKAVSDATTEITTVIGTGEFVLMETVNRGTFKGPLGRLSATDKPFVVHRAVMAQLKDRLVTRMSTFMNGKELAEAVGQWPPPIEE